ncbi:MAG: amidohydrolase family protein [Fidelibacterota bacterium]
MIRILPDVLLIFFVSIISASDPIPAPVQDHPILLKNGVIHTVGDTTLPSGAILFENGKITAIKKMIIPPGNAEVIDLEGKHVYPGFISSVTSIGLMEIGAVKATVDFAERGRLNPNVRANVSYNPDSEIIPVTRSNGVLLANATPASGLISGQSSLMMLDGWTWENATLKHPTGLHINWPKMTLNLNPKAKKSLKKQKQERQQQLQDLDDFFDQVRAYAKLREINPKNTLHQQDQDLRLEGMLPFLRRESPIFVHANEIRQIEAAIHWAKRQKVNIIIIGGRDAWRTTDLLKKNQIPVIYESVLSLPYRRYEDYDQTFKTPARLYQAGVQFCIAASGASFETPHQRNLPYHAAMAAAYGLPKEVALKSITLFPAEILGVADQIGSLAVGKDATLFITDGDPLDARTHVEQAFIQGKKIDMRDRHKILYQKYQEKYRQLGLLKD